MNIFKSFMESLFAAKISVNNKNAVYQVYFEDDKYVFKSEDKDNELPNFSFRREHDEWQDQQPLSPQLKNQAIKALENYLLAQH